MNGELHSKDHLLAHRRIPGTHCNRRKRCSRGSGFVIKHIILKMFLSHIFMSPLS